MAYLNKTLFNIPIKCFCGINCNIAVHTGGVTKLTCLCGEVTIIQFAFDILSFKIIKFGINSTIIQTISLDDIENGVFEMPKATLSYEALAVDTEGNVIEGAYRLKLEGNFKQHVEPIVKFIKASIPSSERTYDPTTYEWFYHEKWHPFMEQAFKGSHYTVIYGVTKEAFTELKRKQAEWAKQAGQSFQHKQYDTNNDLISFADLLLKASIPPNGYLDWTKEEAIKAYKKAIRFYHPDLHPERAAQASELNEVWSRLKEGYYIK